MSDGVPIYELGNLCFTSHDKRGFADMSGLGTFEGNIIVSTHNKVTILSSNQKSLILRLEREVRMDAY